MLQCHKIKAILNECGLGKIALGINPDAIAGTFHVIEIGK